MDETYNAYKLKLCEKNSSFLHRFARKKPSFWEFSIKTAAVKVLCENFFVGWQYWLVCGTPMLKG
jgi:hypothetical protein